MSLFNKKIEYDCKAEIYLAKKFTDKFPILSWNRVYDTQDEISYVIEFDGKEYNENIYFINEKTACWRVNSELVENKVYMWRVKSFDGYEYSDYSKPQYIQYVKQDFREIKSFIDIKTDKRKNRYEFLNSEIKVNKTIFESCLKSEIFVDKVMKFIPGQINVSIPKNNILQSFIDVKKRNYDFLDSEIFIKTKRILPPKGPLLVDMQSEFDYVTGNLKPIFSWWKSLDELFCDNITYEFQIDKNQFFIEPIFFYASNIKNPISEQMVYPIPIELNQDTYYWRIRSTDGINYSEWVYGSPVTIDCSNETIEAEINVVNNFIRKDLISEIVVKPKEVLKSELLVLGKGNSFMPSITTVWAKENESKISEIYVYIGNAIEHLLSEIYVEYKFQEEYTQRSRIYVYPISTIECEVGVNMSFEYLFSEINILKNGMSTSESELNCEIEVIKDFIKAELEVYRSQLNSEVNIIKTDVQDRIEANCDVIKNILESELFIYHAKEQNDLNAKIEVYPISFEELYSNITVLQKFDQVLQSNIDVFNQKTISNLSAKIKVYKPIYLEGKSTTQAEIKVTKTIWNEAEETISAKLYIPIHITLTENLKSEMFVFNKQYNSIGCNVEVKSIKLDKVKVYSNQNSVDWHNNNEIYFWWEITEENKDVVCGYIMQFNQIPDYELDLGKDYYEHSGGIQMFKANVFDNSGEYYFHIQSFNKYYQLSPISHYKVLYNNKPSIPEGLKINGNILTQENKLISKNEINIFSWDKCFDLDQNDFNKIKYEMMICNEPNFEYPEYVSELLDENKIELSFESYLFSGIYYWKVRSFDGKQYSDWSKISSFIINTAPTTPTDIEFFEKNK